MSLWRQIRQGLRVLTNRAAADRDVDDEAGHYFEESAAAFEAKGLSAGDARRAARMEVGNPTVIREQVREHGWENRIAAAFDDVRHAARRLSRNPGFSAAAILTLALGIGATATIFSVIDGVLLRPLPYTDSRQLIALWHTAPGANLKDLRMAPSLYLTYKEESRVFQDIAIWNGGRSTVTGLAEPEELPTLFVTHEFLRVLDVAPAIGRGFEASDDDWRSARTALLSDAYWKQRFGGAGTVLGERIVIDGNAHEVIGVLPPSFEFLDEKVSLVVPKRLNRNEVRLIQFSEDGIARLKPGVTLEQANADVARCILLAPAKFPLNAGFAANAFVDARISPTLRFLKDHLVGDIGKTLWVLLGAVGILLLIACANVANLLLVRADGRQRELAVRAALGAGWARIARELLAESLLLGVAGGVIGLALCSGALQLVAHSSVAHLPRIANISIDPVTLAFTLSISIAAGLIFGLIPVLKYARPHISDALRGGAGRSIGQSRERHRARAALVIVQVALAMVLLVGSGLMFRTFQALRGVDPGFTRPHEVQAVRISIPQSQVKEPERVIRMQEAVLRKFEAIAGVGSVSITNAPPMEGGSSNPVFVADHDYGAGALPPVRRMRNVSPGYLSTVGSRLVAGRDLTWEEVHNAAPVALVSENMARELWHGPRAALGKRIRESLNREWREVIGVVADLRDDGITRNAPTIVYWPLMQKNGAGAGIVPRNVDLLIRTPRAGSTMFVQELQQALRTVNPNLPLANVRTLGAIYERSMARTYFALVLIAIAGSMALILGVVGIYGVIAYSVSQRTRDIGIRIALGSTLQGVTRMFVREGLILSVIGATCGLLTAFAVTRLMKSLLFGISPIDPMTYGLVFAGLVLAAVLASWLPARRAASVDPMEALRAE
ncbi:MAG: ADOP family duplicated permease [Bryobacteraceae bacterium]